MTNCRAKTSRCSHRTSASHAKNAAKAAGTSADTACACACACDQSRKVLRARPTHAAAARSLCPAARHCAAAASAYARSRRVASFDPAATGEALAAGLKSETAGPSNMFLDPR
jgi:hypothetical protein